MDGIAALANRVPTHRLRVSNPRPDVPILQTVNDLLERFLPHVQHCTPTPFEEVEKREGDLPIGRVVECRFFLGFMEELPSLDPFITALKQIDPFYHVEVEELPHGEQPKSI